ncbi:extracellular solute-binding protein [Microbacterium sp.]|uniref:sugar ABC transporter substrate-binding protein n=1 Tax=Microbacterium sp. TaxID=51671 RepID=UPI003340DE56
MTQQRGRRVALAATVTLAAALTLAACSGTPSSPATPGASGPAGTGDRADLVIWTNNAVAPVLDKAAQEFAKRNGITVSVQGVSNLPGDFITADDAGFGPDVVVGPNDWVGNLVQNGSISPIVLTADQRASFEPVALDAVGYGGQTYGVPYAFESAVLFRNTSMAPKAPSTFEDLVATGEDVVASGAAERVLSLQVGQQGDAYSMQALYSSAGGYLFGTNEDGSSNADDLGVGGAGSVAFAQKLHQYGEKGNGVFTRSVTVDNAIGLFAEGKAPYLISGPWALPTIRTAGVSYAIDPIPGFADGGPARPFVGVQAFYVAAHGASNAFAQEFVTGFATTDEVQRALYGVDPRPPASRAVLAEVSAKDSDTARIAAAAAAGIPLPGVPRMASVWEPLGRAEAAVIAGEDPATTMKKAGEAIASKGK